MVAETLIEHTDNDSIVILRRFNEAVMKVSAGLNKLLQAHHFAG
jgi:hypothetical protein